MTEFLVAAIPFLLLVVALLFGRYPGCEAAMRLAERIASGTRAAAAATAEALQPRPPVPGAAQGGLLLALSLSGRAPPA
jgi:hypothetical protein